MRKFLIIAVKWLIAIALLAAIGFVGWRFYTNRTLSRQYVGDQSYLLTDRLNESNTIGIASRAPSMVVYAPLDMLAKQNKSIQVKRYDNEQSLWDDLSQDKVEFILVSLDQFALRAMSQPCKIAFPYAISQGLDTVVCGSKWDSLPSAQPRRVAYVTNTTSAYVAQYLANQRMDSDSPVQLVGASSPAEAQALLKSGQVEAASLSQPHVSALLGQGYQELPNWTPPAIYEVCVSRTTASKDGISYTAPLFRTFAASLFSSLEKMRTMPGPLYSQIARLTNTDRNEVRDILGNNITFLDGARAYELMQSGELAALLQQALEFWLMGGAYPAPLSAQVPSDPARLIQDVTDLERCVNINRTNNTSQTNAGPSPSAEDSTQSSANSSSDTDKSAPSNAGSSPEPVDSSQSSADSSPETDNSAPFGASTPTDIPDFRQSSDPSNPAGQNADAHVPGQDAYSATSGSESRPSERQH